MEINDLEVQIDFIKFVRMKYESKQCWLCISDINIFLITATTTTTAVTLFDVYL